MPEDVPTTANFSLLSSLPPPTSEIVYCQNTTHNGKVSFETLHPIRKRKRLPSMGGTRIFAGTALTHMFI